MYGISVLEHVGELNTQICFTKKCVVLNIKVSCIKYQKIIR